MMEKEKTKRRGRPKKKVESKKVSNKKEEKIISKELKSNTQVSRKKRLLPHNLLLELDKLRDDIDSLSKKIDLLKNT